MWKAIFVDGGKDIDFVKVNEWAAKPRCHSFGGELWIVYGDDELPWPSYSNWIVPGTYKRGHLQGEDQ